MKSAKLCNKDRGKLFCTVINELIPTTMVEKFIYAVDSYYIVREVIHAVDAFHSGRETIYIVDSYHSGTVGKLSMLLMLTTW